jgi:hypothetical protein
MKIGDRTIRQVAMIYNGSTVLIETELKNIMGSYITVSAIRPSFELYGGLNPPVGLFEGETFVFHGKMNKSGGSAAMIDYSFGDSEQCSFFHQYDEITLVSRSFKASLNVPSHIVKDQVFEADLVIQNLVGFMIVVMVEVAYDSDLIQIVFHGPRKQKFAVYPDIQRVVHFEMLAFAAGSKILPVMKVSEAGRVDECPLTLMKPVVVTFS